MNLLGLALSEQWTEVDQLTDAAAVQEAELSMKRRLGASEESLVNSQSNLAVTYGRLGRYEQALSMQRDAYSGSLGLYGEENGICLMRGSNLANTLWQLKHFEEAASLLRNMIPVARRVLGESRDLTLRMRGIYAMVLYKNDTATLADNREAVTTLEDIVRIGQRAMGGAHPLTELSKVELRDAQAALRAREDGIEVKFV